MSYGQCTTTAGYPSNILIIQRIIEPTSPSDNTQDVDECRRGARLLLNGRPEEDSVQQGQPDKPIRHRLSISHDFTVLRSPWSLLVGTQKEQDAEDEKARQKANKDLVQSWMDRLQLISVIVSFSCQKQLGSGWLMGTTRIRRPFSRLLRLDCFKRLHLPVGTPQSLPR
jgi:hypothetical protein